MPHFFTYLCLVLVVLNEKIFSYYKFNDLGMEMVRNFCYKYKLNINLMTQEKTEVFAFIIFKCFYLSSTVKSFSDECQIVLTHTG